MVFTWTLIIFQILLYRDTHSGSLHFIARRSCLCSSCTSTALLSTLQGQAALCQAEEAQQHAAVATLVSLGATFLQLEVLKQPVHYSDMDQKDVQSGKGRLAC